MLTGTQAMLETGTGKETLVVWCTGSFKLAEEGKHEPRQLRHGPIRIDRISPHPIVQVPPQHRAELPLRLEVQVRPGLPCVCRSCRFAAVRPTRLGW